MSGIRTVPAVLDYLIRQQNLTVTVNEVMAATGFTKSQVQNAMLSLREKVEIEVVAQGHAWIYRGERSNKLEGEIYEFLARTKDGKILVQDTCGNPYWLVEAKYQ